MSRQSRFETTKYREHEIRVRAAQVAPDAKWTLWVDVYALSGKGELRIGGQLGDLSRCHCAWVSFR